MSTKRKGNGKYHDWITEEGCLKIEGWARDGLTNEQIAHNIGITSETLRVWNNKYSAISVALKTGKEVIDRKVENALLKKALGSTYKEVRVEESELGIKTTTTIKEVPGDTTAQIFWLKNRKYIEWRDRREIETSVSTEDKLETYFDKLGKVIDDG